MKPKTRQTNRIIIGLCLFLILAGLVSIAFPAFAQETTPVIPTEQAPTAQPGVPVEIAGEILFYVYERVGSFSPAERAAIIQQRINNLATNPFQPDPELTIAESDQGMDILADGELLLTVTEKDANAVGLTRDEAAEKAVELIQAAIIRAKLQNTPEKRLMIIGEFLLILAILITIEIAINWIYHKTTRRIDESLQKDRGLFSRSGFFHSESPRRIVKLSLNIIRWILFFIVLVIVAPFGLSLFPATARIAGRLLELLMLPLARLWTWLTTNQSNFITIVIIVVITYVLIRFTRYFFKEIETGGIKIHGFEPDWAPFTSRIIAFLLIIAAVIIAFPYVPGSDSKAFQGITVFLGLLFTLSSTAAVANIVAGVIQTYTGSFKVGEVIKIGEVTGIVTEKKLLTTRVRTIKNEEVSFPNSVVLSNNVTNYSIMAKNKGLILYTTITIGYDAPWKTVHELLISAAKATPDILEEPEPFVLQTSLNDFHISYQINCYTNHPERMARIYSELHATIQDKFNQAGVEIMSPGFLGLRDGNTTTTPADYRPDNYQPPGFRIDQ